MSIMIWDTKLPIKNIETPDNFTTYTVDFVSFDEDRNSSTPWHVFFLQGLLVQSIIKREKSSFESNTDVASPWKN